MSLPIVRASLAALVLILPACKHAESSSTAAVEIVHGAAQEAPPAPQPGPAPLAVAAAPATDFPKTIDPKDLDATERKVLAEILAEQFDPCGKPRSFQAALEAADCPLAIKLGATVVKLLQAGHGKKQAVAMLLREIERLNTVVQLDVTGAPRLGPENAKVSVVVYSDFECPFCRHSVEPMKKLQGHYQFALYYRFFPLKLAHPNAEGTAKAGWAAHQQGKFWALHDAMFGHPDSLDWPSVRKLAAGLGLDMKRFEADFESPQAKAAVDASEKSGEAAGVDGTPTFFVNGRRAETLMQVQELVRDLQGQGDTALPATLSADDLGEAAAPTAPAAAHGAPPPPAADSGAQAPAAAGAAPAPAAGATR